MKKDRIRLAVFVTSLVLAVAWMIVIYGFSSNNAVESTVQSHAVTEFLIKIFNPDFENMTPEVQEQMISDLDGIVRKTAHFVAYAALGVLVYTCVASFPFAKKEKLFLYILTAFPVCVAFAVTDEYHQTFVSGRAGRFTDVLIDSGGAACGIAMAVLVVMLIKRKIKLKGDV